MNKNQALLGSFLDQDRCLYIVAGVLFHSGLIWANLPLFALGVCMLPVRHTDGGCFFSLGALVPIGIYTPILYGVFKAAYVTPILMTAVLSSAFFCLWWLWSYVYLHLRRFDTSFVCASVWVVFSAYLWQQIGIGFYDISPLVIHTPWERTVPFLGGGVGPVVVWMVHLLRHKILGHLLWVFPLLCPIWPHHPTADTGQPTIYAEGLGHFVSTGDAIVSRRLYEGGDILHASVGVGAVEGISIKQHLIPFVESGYGTKYHSRLMVMHDKTWLVLICNDALFSDIWKEAKNAQGIIVLSHLEALNTTPMMQYFDKRLRYIQLRTGLAVRHVDQHFIRDYH